VARKPATFVDALDSELRRVGVSADLLPGQYVMGGLPQGFPFFLPVPEHAMEYFGSWPLEKTKPAADAYRAVLDHVEESFTYDLKLLIDRLDLEHANWQECQTRDWYTQDTVFFSITGCAVTEIRRTTGRQLDLDNPDHMPLDDPQTFEMIRRSDTPGCFQIESPGQMDLVGRLQPRHMQDIIADIILFRPAPDAFPQAVPPSESGQPRLSARLAGQGEAAAASCLGVGHATGDDDRGHVAGLGPPQPDDAA
jgi:hypothetical protein